MFLFFSFNFLLTFMLACLVELSLVSFVCLFVVVFFLLFVCWLIGLFVCLFTCLFTCLFLCFLFVCLLDCFFVCLFVSMGQRLNEEKMNRILYKPYATCPRRIFAIIVSITKCSRRSSGSIFLTSPVCTLAMTALTILSAGDIFL